MSARCSPAASGATRDYPTDAWPVGWAAAIAAQVAATLVDVHRVDVVHRDIKPSNVMVSANGLVKVLDFGVAILRGARALPRLTQIGATVGSPPYMPPEQVLGNPVGPAADVYALGCMLHKMVTGRVPYAETENRSYQDHHVNTLPSSMRAMRPGVPSDLDDLVLTMLAKRPSSRPDANSVYEALLPLVRSGPPSTVADQDPRRPFLRPLAPMARGAGSGPGTPARTPAAPVVPLSIDDALDLLERVDQLSQESQLHHAIDLLDDAVKRSAHLPDLEVEREVKLELKVRLAVALFLADEFSRAAGAFDAIRPAMAGRDDAAELRYDAGVSHAEIGDIDAAIDYLTAFHAAADPSDPRYQDATHLLGMMLPVVGRAGEGLRHLESLRPVLVDAYGSDSIHVRTLDRHIAQIRRTLPNP